MRGTSPMILAVLLATSAQAVEAQERGGFTLLMTLGYGIRSGGSVTDGTYYAPTTVDLGSQSALGGLNIGIGGFLSDRTAMMFRISGTTFTYKNTTPSGEYSHDLTSGVGGLDIQWWTSDRLNVEMVRGLDSSRTTPPMNMASG